MRKALAIVVIMLAACVANASAAAKRALLIGLSTYQKHNQPQLCWSNIHGANDVALIGGTLKRQGFSVTTIANQQATAQAMRKALARLARQSRPGDLVYIHFSGHGQPFEDSDGDEADGWDEALVPYNAGRQYVAGAYDGSNHITDDELNAAITNIRKKVGAKGFVYVVLDACHMGGASRGDEDEDSVFVRGTAVGFSRSGKPFVPRIDARPVIRVPAGRNMANTCYIEACRAYQSNREIRVGTQYYGPLTFYVNKVLSRHALSASTSWVDDVKKLMASDKRLVRQNIVVETSAK